MQSLFNKTILTIAVIFVFTVVVRAQQDEAAVRACLENYMSGDGNRMEKAFHPSATMKYVDISTNEFKDVPIADFIARVKANTSRPDRKIGIESINIEGNAATGKIKIETSNAIMYDYMNMLKVDGEWKIVSKIFSRKNK